MGVYFSIKFLLGGRGLDLLYRFVLFIITVVFMFAVLLLALYGFGLTNSTLLPETIHSFYNQWESGLLSMLGFIAGAWVIYPFFSGRKKETTLISQTNMGEIDITLDALDNLVKGIAVEQEAVVEMDTRLKTGEEGLRIYLTGRVLPGIPLPELTQEMQKIVKSYVEEITGVTVEEVKVRVDGIESNKKMKLE